jgi:surface antigen
MLAKSFQALVKCLILVSIASPVYADINVPLSTTNGVRQDYQPNGSILAVGINLFKMVSGSLGSADRDTHTMTVVHAMENLDNGDIVEWYNTVNDTAGRVRVVMTYPVQGGVCRKFFSEVRIKNTIRDYNEQGCKTMDSRYWSFSR